MALNDDVRKLRGISYSERWVPRRPIAATLEIGFTGHVRNDRDSDEIFGIG
jgi:hypothetical protein